MTAPFWSFKADLGGDERTFSLNYKLACEYERNHPPCIVTLRRLTNGEWSLVQVREIIRLGLIGGGMDPAAALQLVREYVEERPISETAPVATQLLSQFIFGPPKPEPEPEASDVDAE